MLLLGICFFFENSFGYLTLAPLASAFLFVAIFMIGSAAIYILIPMYNYGLQYTKVKLDLERSLLADDRKRYFDVLKDCDPVQIPVTPINLVLVGLNAALYLTAGFLAIRHLMPHFI
jgi:hypothetical protein